MAIKIQQIADNFQRIGVAPNSFTGLPRVRPPGSQPEPAKRVFAKSKVYDRLYQEMLLYAQRQTSGRSFLISGYRGAGNTMMVGNTIQDVAEYLARENYPVRPLYVRLHGPDLLPSDVRRAAADKPVAPAPAVAENATPKAAQPSDPANSGSDSEIVLKQVAIALYRTAADEFWNSFRERIYENPTVFEGERSDLLELAAQLRVELDAAADLACFRTIWKRAGRLATGVLFPLWPAPLARGGDPRGGTGDQGFLELMALSSAAQAYRVVSGKITETQVSSDEAKRQDKWSLALSGATKNLVAPLAGLAAGIFAGAAVYGSSKATSPYASIVTGLLSGLAVSLTLGYSGTRSRDTTKKVDISFLPDRSLTSLDRMIPLLVERFRLAGLAPIFVVDELDKIPDPFKRIGALVDQLKHFITERAFFCFITDRGYIEKLERESLNLAYPRQHTYFSGRLLVYYMPRQLHGFLKPPHGILQIDESSSAELRRTDMEDVEVLPYVLLHRSKMHAFDLRGQLAKFTEAGQLFCAPGVIRTRQRYLFDLLIQVAVEYLLEQPDLLARGVDDPYFAQLALDALYYPSRSWERGEAHLDLTKPVFTRYIADRIGEYKESAAAKEDATVKPLVSKSDLNLLYRSAQNLAEFLVDPNSLFLAVEQLPLMVDGQNPAMPRFSPTVLDALPIDALLLKHEPAKDHYEWQADVSGRTIVQLKLSSARRKWERLTQEIKIFESLLGSLGGGKLTLGDITTGLAILPSSPSWMEVELALQRLDKKFGGLLGTPKPENDLCDDQTAQDSDALSRFAKMLYLNRESLTYALLLSALLNRYDKGDIGEKLKLISKSLQLHTLRSSQTRDLLRNVWETWSKETAQFQGWATDLQTLSLNPWRLDLQRALTQIATSPYPEDTDGIVSAAWTRWKGDRSKLQPHAYDLIALTLRRGPLSVLSYDFDSFGIYQWSQIFLDSHTEEEAFLRDLAEEKLGLKTGSRRVLLVLADQGSKLKDWKPEAGYSCIAVERSSFGRLALHNFEYVLIELSGSPVEMAQIRMDYAKALGVSTQPTASCRYIVFGRIKPDESDEAPLPYIGSPSGIADAVKKADATVPVVIKETPERPPRPWWFKSATLVQAATVAILTGLVLWFSYRGHDGQLAMRLSAASNDVRSQAHSATPASVLLAIEALRFNDSTEAEAVLRANLKLFPAPVQRDVENQPLQAVFSRDGSKLAVLLPARIQVWSGVGYRDLLPLPTQSCSTADFSPNRKVLALGCGNTVTINGLPLLPSPTRSVKKVLFANNDVLLSADDNGVLVSDVNSRKSFASAHNHFEKLFRSLDAAPDGNSFLYASATTTSVCHLVRGKITSNDLPKVGPINQAAYAPPGSTFDFATAGQNGDLMIWNWIPGSIINTNRLPCPGPLSQMAIGPKGRFVAASCGGAITLWNSLENRVNRLAGTGVVTGLDFSADGKLLAASTTNGRVVLWDLTTKEQVAELQTKGAAKSVAFSPTGGYLVVTADIFQMWDMKGNVNLASLSGDALLQEACSRIPVIPTIEWKTYLGNDDYRPACK